MRVEVDRDLCCGAGQCALIVPEVFDQDEDDGLVVLLEDAPGREHEEAVREAGAVCPTGAITVSG
ncbi:ferredoxin [Nocardiopsis ganjiahuensis]|uniref:ferredoxin n=1 Tax=Nocardiopsis ganjiahuensis TaxID=239984 RepID=UPI00047798E8|nr:ferredoxin [Nocardiopsis ganjiahuensis]